MICHSPYLTFFLHNLKHPGLLLSALYHHGMSKVSMSHTVGDEGERGRWEDPVACSKWVTRPTPFFPDTCQTAVSRLSVEMEMSRGDTTCQRWRWWFDPFLHQRRSSCADRVTIIIHYLLAFRRSRFFFFNTTMSRVGMLKLRCIDTAVCVHLHVFEY